MSRSRPGSWERSVGKGTDGRQPGALQDEGRPMSKISFDRHLIEAAPFGRGHASKWLLSACYGHSHFI